jgi:metallo-beta-lactamase class B
MKTNILLGALAALAASVLSFAAPAPLSPAFQAMNGERAPFKIADNLYYVGMSDVTSYLVVTPKGYFLLDGGFEQSAPAILAHIRTLGFDPSKVKYLLNSHAHFDHAGGLAALKTATGAVFEASAPDAPVLAAGGQDDFALHDTALFPPVKADRIVRDGDTISLGGVTMTAHITAGHTKGCTTWTLPLTVDGKPQTALFLCSLSVLDAFRLVDNPRYPQQAADFEKSFATLKTLKCDVFLASHGQFFGLAEKSTKLAAGATPNPFVDPEACHAYVVKAEAAFDRRLAQCKAEPATCGDQKR